MAIPLECKMPDLSGLDSPLLNRLFVQLLIGERGLSPKVKLYRRNFVRLIDKALREYHNARETIIAQIEEKKRLPEEMARDGRIIYIVAFTDYIENCINAIRRLYKLLDRIKSEKESPILPRELRRLVETQSKSIIDLRDSVEHIDERIQKGELSPNKPLMLIVSKNEDSVVIDNYEIKFTDLALVLEKMNEIAKYILTIKKVEP
jgi:hypothetical protein